MTENRALSGKTAIVTGASSGIGRAIAEKLGGAGAHVYLGGRSQAAMQMLASAGFANVVDNREGFVGSGGEQVWVSAGLPTEGRPAPGRAHPDLREKLPG